MDVGRKLGALAAAAALLAVWLIPPGQGWVESGYAQGLYPWIVAALTSLTGRLPFSLAEGLIGLTLGTILAYLAWRVRQLWSGSNRRLVIFLRVLQDSVLFGALVVLLGYGFWGLNYRRLPLADKLEWPPPPRERETLAPQLEPLAREVVVLTNQAYRQCCAETGTVPSPTPIPLPHLDQELNRTLDRVSRQLRLDAPNLGTTRAKPVFASALMDYLGLAGFYFPWTGEANFNRRMPLLEAAHSIAHEKAHQLGFAGEDEANFVGFLACVRSPSTYLRYSGYVFANRQLLSLLRGVDRQAWREVSSGLDPGVVRDEIALRDYWRRYEGPSRDVAQVVNNAHLRLNRVEGGILSYGRSVELLLQLAAHNGNSLRFD